jgi:hypothetical protein
MSSTNARVISSLRIRRYSQRRIKKNFTSEVNANVHRLGSIGSRMFDGCGDEPGRSGLLVQTFGYLNNPRRLVVAAERSYERGFSPREL